MALSIAGDPAALRALSSRLTSRATSSDSSATALSDVVDKLISDNHWRGSAADTFRGAWGQDAAALGELRSVLGAAAGILDRLATGLDAASNDLDAAYAAARRARVVMVHGVPAHTQPSEAQGTAGTRFNTAASAALEAAATARSDASDELGTLLVSVDPEADGSGYSTVPQLAGLGALLRGYYSLPSRRLDEMRAELAAAERLKGQVKHETKHPKGHSPEEQAAMRELRRRTTEERLALRRTAAAAEELASSFKGGRLLGTTVADLVRASGGELEALSRLGRLAESIPVLDVAAAGLATWDMAKHDHEKGWSWAHAIAVEGGANAAGLLVGTATDAIPYVGPFLAPFAAYGTAAGVSETFHEGHWTRNMDEHGVLGPAYALADTGKAVFDNDVVGVGKGLVHDAEHPVEAAKGLWKEAKWLVGG